jgi:hypothetical protein
MLGVTKDMQRLNLGKPIKTPHQAISFGAGFGSKKINWRGCGKSPPFLNS